MPKYRIHLLAVSGHCRPLLKRLKCNSYARIRDLAQQAVGPRYEVTADTALMNPTMDEHRGGRTDDCRRGNVLNRLFADERVRAIVTLRGGAWLTRILAELNFGALGRRKSPLYMFGFSELTTLINISARYRRVRAYYDHDLGHLEPQDGTYRQALRSFLRDVIRIIEAGTSARRLTGTVVRQPDKIAQPIHVVGGCLTVLTTLLGTPFSKHIDTRGKWLALEDVHDEPLSIDRHLAQLKLAGAFKRCSGLLLGDFHMEDYQGECDDLTPAVLELLRYHLPSDRHIPIIAHCNFGHCHPAGPVPINRPLRLMPHGPKRERRVIIVPADDC